MRRAMVLLAVAAAVLCPAAALEPVIGREVANRAQLAADGSPPVSVVSNLVTTGVIGPCLQAPLALKLEVEPGGAVSPGAALRYALMVENLADAELQDVEVRLPLDLSLTSPTEVSSGPTQRLPDGAGPTMVTIPEADPGVVVWRVAALGPGQKIRLRLKTAVRPETIGGTLIHLRGSALPSECTGAVDSNDAITLVITPALRLIKEVDLTTAVPGDALRYRLLVEHTGAGPALDPVELVDSLPERLQYVGGSARLDGEAIPDPQVSGSGRTLRFALGAMSEGARHELSFSAIVGPVAAQGELVNRAVAIGRAATGVALRSNDATAATVIEPGPFRRDATLVGRVFVDDDQDGMIDADEPGVPGILVLLEDGSGAVTDITGRWHIEGVRPGTRAVRIDPDGLPSGLSAAPEPGGLPLDPALPIAAGGVPDAPRLLQVRASTLVVSNFALAPAHAARCRVEIGDLRLALPTASLLDPSETVAPAATRSLGELAALIVDRGLGEQPLQFACESNTGVPAPATPALRALLERALEQRAQALRAERDTDDGDEDATLAGEPAEEFTAPAAAKDPLEQLVRTAQQTAAIITPSDGARADREQIAVEVVYPLGYTPELTVNGTPIGDDRIGTTSHLNARQLSASRYIGVALRPGSNLLSFRAIRSDGVASERSTCHVMLPETPVALRFTPPPARWVADGATSATLRIEAVDGSGMRTTEQPVVTLQVEGGTLIDADLDPALPGLQLRLNQGQATLRFAPFHQPGPVVLHASAGPLQSETTIQVVPGGGPWRVLGLAEGTLAGDGGREGDGGAGPSFDDEISGSGGRIALTARGPIGEASRLTVSLDTARTRDPQRLFRSYAPDELFPVYGDTSNPSEEAERQGKLFLRVDTPRGFAQWGDFNSRLERTELMRYDRALEGLSARSENGRLSFQGFAAPSKQTLHRDLFTPDGTSGPYLLQARPIVARSETVVLETRDRYRTEQVLQRQIKVRDLDYTLDTASGTLFFRGPIPPFDERFNPLRIVVTYEQHRDSGKTTWIAGGRAALAISDRLETGVSAIREDRDADPLQLVGVDLNWRPAPGIELRAEVAGSQLGDGVRETATRFDLDWRRGATFGWELSYRDLPVGFENPALLGAAELGTRRAATRLTWQPRDVWRLRGEADLQEDERTGFERRTAGLHAERQLGAWTALLGARYAAADGGGFEQSATTQLELGGRGRIGKRWSAELLHAQTLGGDDSVPGYPSRTAAGIAYELRPGTKLHLRQEWQHGDGVSQDRTLLGIESRISETTRGLAQYALEQGATGSALRATSGIETILPIGPRSRLNFGAARIDTARGDGRGDYTALSGGYEYRAGNSLLSTRYELWLGEQETRHLLSGSGALRLRDPWTVFVRELFSASSPERGSGTQRSELLLGAAWRPLESRLQFLARLDGRLGWGSAPTSAGGVSAGVSGDPGAPQPDPTEAPAIPGIGFGAPREAPQLLRDAVSLSLAGGAALTARDRIAASLIVRRVAADEEVPATLTHLLSLHYTRQLAPRWTVGGSLRRFVIDEVQQQAYGAGIEFGWRAFPGVWLTGGYNFVGFEFDGFPDAERTASGPFVSLRMALDEHTWQRLSSLRLDRP